MRSLAGNIDKLSESPLQALPLAIVSVNQDGLVQTWNPAAEVLFGWRAEDVINRPLPIFSGALSKDSAVLIASVFRAGRHLGLEFRTARKDGTPIDVSVWTAPVQDEAGRMVGTFAILVDVTEQKQTEAALVARTNQMEAIRTVTTEITRELDLTSLLRLIIKRAIELVGATSGAVTLWDDRSEELAPQAWFGHDAWFGSLRWRLGEGAVGLAAQHREGMLVNDYPSFQQAHPRIKQETQVTAMIAEPLLYGDLLLGVLAVDNNATVRPFGREDQEVLRLFATQAAIAIENARLYEAAQQELVERRRAETALLVRTRQLEAVRAVTEEITRELDLPVLLRLIVQRAVDLVGADTGLIRLWDEAAGLLTSQAWHGSSDDERHTIPLHLNEGVSGAIAARRAGLIVNDFLSSPYAPPPLSKMGREVAILGEPLLYRDRLIGVLTIGRHHYGRPFTEEDRQLLVLFAAHAAIAIENAELYAGAERSARASRSLYDVARSLTTSLNMSEVLHLIAEKTTELLDTPHAQVVLWDEATRALRLGATHGTEASQVHAQTFRLGEGVNGIVAQTRSPLVVNDYQAFPQHIPGFEQVQASIGVPLLYRDRFLGVLNSHATRPGTRFTQEHLQLLTSFGAQAAVALENARLFEEVTQHHEELRELSARLAETEEAERARLARALHDEVGQSLSALGINLNIIQAQLPADASDSIRSRLEDSHDQLRQATARARNLMAQLHPLLLDEYGLEAALRWYAGQVSSRAGITVEVWVEQPIPRLSGTAELALFRIAQEALTNAVKHAQTPRVLLSIEVDATCLRLVIADKGAGFESAPPAKPRDRHGWGLAIMAERAQSINGRLQIETRPGKGTRVVAEVPR